MGFRGTPRTRTRKTRADMGSRSTRLAFRRLPGGRLPDPPHDRSRPEALHALSCPFRDVSPQPRTAASLEPTEADPRAFARYFLSWAFVPCDTCRAGGSASWRWIPPPPRTTSGVWVPPSRLSPPVLPAPKRRSVLGLRPPRPSSSRARGAPFGVLALLTLPGPPPIPEGMSETRPPSGPRARSESVLSPAGRSRLTVDAFLGFSPPELSPHPTGPSLVVTMPALTPSGGMTSRSAWASGLCGADGLAGPFPNCRLSWGFAPCDRRGTPFVLRGAGSWIHLAQETA